VGVKVSLYSKWRGAKISGDMWNWMNVFNSLLASLLGALITGSIALYVFRKNMGHMQTEKTEKQKKHLRKSAAPLFADLGSLIHRCQQTDFDAAMSHITVMAERRQRGEYDMPLAPVVIQNEWMNLLPLLERLRFDVINGNMDSEGARRAVVVCVTMQIAHTMSMNLNSIRN
jgi:hypothetical protein